LHDRMDWKELAERYDLRLAVLFSFYYANILAGPIEKGSNEGQAIYANDLVKHIRASVTSRTRVGTAVSKGKKLRKKKGDSSASPDMSSSNASIKPADWGLFEPLHGPLGPVVELWSDFFCFSLPFLGSGTRDCELLVRLSKD
jgi:hypothetical protein